MAYLKGAYQTFLASPNGAALNDNVSLSYITTLTTINGAAAVVKHFAAHEKVLKRKEEKALDAIESDNALYLEVETALEFISSGGAYLPGLDDNFLSDHTVTFPITHIVHFDASQKIQSIRLSWDQGSLLKQIGVIGARARSWPIRDGKDQARLVASSAATALPSSGSGKPPHTTSNGVGQQAQPNGASNGAEVKSKTNATRDPHASLALPSSREENSTEKPKQGSAPAARGSAGPPPRDYGDIFAGDYSEAPRPISPRKENQNPVAKAQSAKPPPRDYHDLFAGGEEDVSPASKGRPSSPLKNITSPGAPKAGAGKNFQPMRLYDDVEENIPDSPKETGPKHMKPHPKKYDHFEFGPSAEQGQPLPSRPKSSKHQSQWDFEDFMTPNKIPQKIRGQDQRHFGWSDDEPGMESPAKPGPPKARPDAHSHFDFVDDGTPEGQRRPPAHPRGAGPAQSGAGLYKNDVFGTQDEAAENKGRPLSTVTNLKDRRKDFEPHFGMTDESSPGNNGPSKQFPGHKTAAIQTMSANWSAADASPAPAHSDRSSSNHPFGPTAAMGKENVGIKSAGDGMGGRKGHESAGPQNSGIRSAGDGMGGKKGNGRAWGFGDDSDGEEAGGRNTGAFIAQRRQQAPAETSHWDF